MKSLRIGLVTMFGAGLLVLSGAMYLRAQGPDIVRQMKDQAEIEALMWRYARALDTRDPEAYASVYAPDGQFGTGPNATKGTAALREMIARTRRNRTAQKEKGEAVDPGYHMTTDKYFEFPAKDQALVHYYWITVVAGAAQGEQTRVAAGYGIDQFVRLKGKWLIKSRNVRAGATLWGAGTVDQR
jgi:hypothetical protein